MKKELPWRRLAPTKTKMKTKLPMGRTLLGTAAVAQKTAAYYPMAVQAYAVVPYRKYQNKRTTYIHTYIHTYIQNILTHYEYRCFKYSHIHSYIHTCIFLHTIIYLYCKYIQYTTCLNAYINTHIHIYIHTYIHIYWVAGLLW